jgi:hypothetical protein
VAAIRTAIERCSVTEGVTYLARGADQLHAGILCQRRVPYVVVVPCEGYSSVFASASDRRRFERLLRSASRTVVLPFEEPSELAFYEAGRRVVDMSEAIIAIWDGEPAKGLGGTADIVKYALAKGRKVIQIQPASGEVTDLEDHD